MNGLEGRLPLYLGGGGGVVAGVGVAMVAGVAAGVGIGVYVGVAGDGADVSLL